ncbi:MAG TPA: hypothetical protein VNE17_03535 [Nitrolancea sp.]|nr:hypothetical protein [Nitrolancea sp.]
MTSVPIKTAIVVLASTETHEGLGRAVNALQLARELAQHGDAVTIIFDGAGTIAAAELANPEHRSHRLFAMVQDHVAGACAFCSAAFDVKDQVEAAGVPLLDEFHGHPSLRSRLADGYHLITF